MARCTASSTESRVKSPFWAREETRFSRRRRSAAERLAAVRAITGSAGVHLTESPDAFEQAPAVQRLGQILRRPEQQSPLLFGEHGLDDHRDLSCSRIGLQRLEHQQAVFSVEIEIEEDRRRL